MNISNSGAVVDRKPTKVSFKRMLITGGRGVLGTGFEMVRAQHPETEFVLSSSKNCDLTDMSSVLRYVSEIKPDAILHLAALSGGIEYTSQYPATVLRGNVLMAFNILEAARQSNVKKTVMTLSTGMFPNKVSYPIKESYIHDGEPHPSNYSYSFAKRLIEPAIRSYRKEYGMNVIGLIPNGIFGENSNFNYESAIMVPALIRRFYENRKGNDKIVVWGDGSPLREYTYAKDLAEIYLWCLENYNDAQVLNVGSTEEVSVKDIAFMVADSLKIDRSRIEFDITKPAGQLRKPTDNSIFVGLSHFTYTPFREGLKKTIDWLCENYDNKLKIRL